MAAPSDTLLQVNFKTGSGTLINVYGSDEQAFDLGLAILHDRIATIVQTEQALNGATAVANVVPLHPQQPPAVAPAVPTPPPVVAPAPAFQQAATPTCVHGPLTARKGNGAKGEWRAWMCPSPKGTPGQCQPNWLRKGTPEWDSFPA